MCVWLWDDQYHDNPNINRIYIYIDILLGLCFFYVSILSCHSHKLIENLFSSWTTNLWHHSTQCDYLTFSLSVSLSMTIYTLCQREKKNYEFIFIRLFALTSIQFSMLLLLNILECAVNSVKIMCVCDCVCVVSSLSRNYTEYEFQYMLTSLYACMSEWFRCAWMCLCVYGQ